MSMELLEKNRALRNSSTVETEQTAKKKQSNPEIL